VIRDFLKKLKGKGFKVAIRQFMTYSAETWAIKKNQEMRMNVASGGGCGAGIGGGRWLGAVWA
jgi:hypothetical protein